MKDIHDNTASACCKSRQSVWYSRNREIVLTKQKNYKRNYREKNPWIVKFDNDKARAKREGYFPSVFTHADQQEMKDIYRLACDYDVKPIMRVKPKDGGLWGPSNITFSDSTFTHHIQRKTNNDNNQQGDSNTMTLNEFLTGKNLLQHDNENNLFSLSGLVEEYNYLVHDGKTTDSDQTDAPKMKKAIEGIHSGYKVEAKSGRNGGSWLASKKRKTDTSSANTPIGDRDTVYVHRVPKKILEHLCDHLKTVLEKTDGDLVEIPDNVMQYFLTQQITR